jgi:hypothetical protein
MSVRNCAFTYLRKTNLGHSGLNPIKRRNFYSRLHYPSHWVSLRDVSCAALIRDLMALKGKMETYDDGEDVAKA